MTDQPKETFAWCAWHPDRGFDIYIASSISPEFPRSTLMNRIFRLSDNDTAYDEMIDGSYWELWEKVQEQGWQIKRVKITEVDDAG